MNKVLSLFTSLLLFTTTMHAQGKLSTREILDRTAERMQTEGGVSAKFTTTTFQGTMPQEEITGTLQMLGDKYFMDTPSIRTWFDGKSQWTLLTDNKEVNLVTPTEEELQASSPTAFLSLYKQGFRLSHEADMLRGKKVWNVTLRPKKRGQEPSRIIVSIEQGTFLPLCLRIRNEGNWARISISDINTNAGLTDATFHFPASQYPDYEIIDMR